MELIKYLCAGFDGYSDKEDNYFNPEMEYYFVKDEAHNLNTHMRESIYEARHTMDIRFLTYSAYDTNNNEHDEAFRKDDKVKIQSRFKEYEVIFEDNKVF